MFNSIVRTIVICMLMLESNSENYGTYFVVLKYA